MVTGIFVYILATLGLTTYYLTNLLAQCLLLINRTKNYFMRSLLYVIAIILIIGWVLGAFVYSAGSIIHVLLVLAIISLLLGFIRRGTVD